MNKTIILGGSHSISNKVSKWLSIMLGIIYASLGIVKIATVSFSYESVLWILTGLGFFTYGLLSFTNTPLTPKVKISNDEIEFKNKLFSRSTRITWSDVLTIEFKPYEIVFQLKDYNASLTYSSNPETSIDIKSSIREIAEQLNIQVSGG